MFLQMISDKQKDLFMKLAIKAAEVNGIVEYEEKNMLKAFSIEMGIQPLYNTEASLDSIVSELKELSDEKSRRIILFEILGILISDSEFDDKEKSFVDELTKAFSISVEQKNDMIGLINEYLNVYKKISKVVIE